MAATRLSPLAQQVMGHPDWLEQEAAERSLHDFVCQMWRYVDPADFQDNWHLQTICEHLEAVTRGEVKRLIINLPPRHSKSSLGRRHVARVDVAEAPARSWAAGRPAGQIHVGFLCPQSVGA